MSRSRKQEGQREPARPKERVEVEAVDVEAVAPGLDLPPALQAIVARLLDKDPEQRFSSARALARALQTVVL